MKAGSWGLLLVLALLWGCSFMLMAICLQSMPVLTTAFSRLALAGLLLLVFVFIRREHSTSIDLAFIKQIALLGLLRAALPITLILWAQARIDSGVAGILNSTSALFTLVVAHFFTSTEKVNSNKLAAVGFGMAGVALIMGTDAIRGLGDQVAGQLAMLGATLSYGFANVYGKRFSSISPAASAAGMLLAGAVLILPFAAINDWPLQQLLALAAFSTACAFVVWFKLIHSVGPNNTVLVTFLIPPIALALGMLFLAESPDKTDLAGLLLIGLGLGLSQKEVSQKQEEQ